ncbi:MAG: hypothetical protein NTW86_28810 [Candidatus Sumerlaeota bacterium]|nr:hypothetical protein [Candidatus Sumerlaeota bacterium]
MRNHVFTPALTRLLACLAAPLLAAVLAAAEPSADRLDKRIDPELEKQGYYAPERMEKTRQADLALKRQTAIERQQARDEAQKQRLAARDVENLPKAQAILEQRRERAMRGNTLAAPVNASSPACAFGLSALTLAVAAAGYFAVKRRNRSA